MLTVLLGLPGRTFKSCQPDTLSARPANDDGAPKGAPFRLAAMTYSKGFNAPVMVEEHMTDEVIRLCVEWGSGFDRNTQADGSSLQG